MNPADRVRLGRTRVSVTRLGLGTAPLGGLFSPVAEEEARATIEQAFAAGLRFFDTAPLYGHGLAEQRLGRVLASKPRVEFVLATKVGRLLRAGAPPDPSQFYQGKPFYAGTPLLNPVFDFSYDGVMRSVDESLERLGLDSIDLLHIHDPDHHFDEALRGAYRALDRLRADETIGAVGVGMNQAAMLVRFAREADVDCFLLAGRYTLLDQTALAELLPVCLERRIAVIAGGVYNSGILADPRPGATFDYIPARPELITRARRLKKVCARHDVPLKAAAIQFPLGHPAVAAVLIGCRSAAEVDENVRMFRCEIPAGLWDDLRREGLIPEGVPAPAAEGRRA
ncbi:MAG: aldo/keto reductase [Bacillati bacterium ANGP1]|uniref:Aldo/keto reductase n=1 Tax=Candidatus Segetimicrobium genomatis TaxID=2569760 RepID=A0A537KBI6_9BACT|nr:MAG: aldo/keto reductase [Terrabacteria group bacterium ANGP1]